MISWGSLRDQDSVAEKLVAKRITAHGFVGVREISKIVHLRLVLK